MSIGGILNQLERERKLFKYLPPDGSRPKRGLYVSAEISREMKDPRSAINFFDQKRPLTNLFDKWVMERPMVVRLAGRNAGAALARLEPPPEEIWEFRLTESAPQLRIFLRFLAPDVLVALSAHNRDYLGSAGSTSGKRSRAWLEAMYGCEAEWNRIFGRTAPFRGRAVADYVTRNATECT